MAKLIASTAELAAWNSGQSNIKLGFLLMPSAVASQLTDLVAECVAADRKKFSYCLVYSGYDAMTVQDMVQGLPITLCPLSVLEQYCQQYPTPLAAMFIQESYFAPELILPAELIRIGLPHGTDIPLKKTLTTYGGLLEFDYVLAVKPFSPMATTAFVHTYPAMLRQHRRPYCAVIPFGMPKFDRFVRKCQQVCEPDSIILHLSNLQLEKADVLMLARQWLRLLLSRFPQYNVIFRPFPSDCDTPQIIELVRYGQQFGNFVFSDSPSYIDDYARGAVMLCFRDYSDHLFAQASSRPVIRLDENFELKLQQIAGALIAENAHNSAATVFNPGSSAVYLLSQFDYILDDEVHPDWCYFSLDISDSAAAVPAVIQRHLDGTAPFHKLALAAQRHFPREFNYVLACVVSLSRTAVQQNQQLAEVFWQKAVSLLACWLEQQPLTQYQLDQLARHLLLAPAPCRAYMLDSVVDSHGYREFVLRLKAAMSEVLPFSPVQLRFRHAEKDAWLSEGAVQLYGAGELALKLLDNSAFRQHFNVVNWVDQNVALHGRQLHNIRINAVATLKHNPAPILICSVAFAEEIVWQLKQQLQLPHEIFFLE